MRNTWLRKIIVVLVIMVLMSTQITYAESANNKLTVEDISANDKSVVVIYALDHHGDVMSQGSGFCIGNGVFLTNFHVIEEATKIKLETEDNMTYEVEGIVAADMECDLALLKTKEDPEMEPLNLGINKKLAKGQQVVAIGSPIGLVNTVSEGIVSGFRSNMGVELVQITAPITYGSSGSPLFDMYGDVVGINSAGFFTGDLNFAVSINHVSDWFAKIKGKAFGSIPVIGRESYTKDTSITDSEVTNVLTTMKKYYNSEDIKNYQGTILYKDEKTRKSYSDVLTTQFKSFNVIMDMKDIKIIKKTAEETLVRTAVSYKEKNHNRNYNDNTIRTLYYLKKIGQHWKIFREDHELLLSITRYYGDEEDNRRPPVSDSGDSTQSDSGDSTKSNVVVVTPGTTEETSTDSSDVVTIAGGISTEAKPINIKASDVKEINISMAIDNYIYNAKDSKIYALNKANKKLIIINTASKKVEKTVTLKYKPSDLCISTDNSMLYIVNEGSNNIVEMKLNDNSVVREFLWDAPSYNNDKGLHYHIRYYDSKLFLIDAKWSPSLWVLDLKALTINDYGQNTNDNDLAEDRIDNVGDFYINEKNGDLYFWQQYGWSAGYAGSNVYRYETTSDGFSQVDDAGLQYPGFQRDPLNSPIMMVEKNKWIVCKSYILNMENLKQKVYKFDEDLYAVDNNGLYAVSKKNIYNLSAFSQVGKLPVVNADFYFFDASNTLYMVDNSKSKIMYCSIK